MRPPAQLVLLLVLFSVITLLLAGSTFAADETLSPITSYSSGFYSGNQLYLFTWQERTAYVVGVFDAFRALEGEFLARFLLDFVNWTTGPGSGQTNGSSEPSDRLPPGFGDGSLRSAAMAAIETVRRVPLTATNYQISSIVFRYLHEHPESRHLPAALLVWRALAETNWE